MNITPLVACLLLLQVVLCSAQECSPPIVNSITPQGLNTVLANWINVNTDSPESYTIRYQPKLTSLADEITLVNIVGESTILSNLLTGQDYRFFIRSECATGQSDWNGPYQFKTSIDNTNGCNLNLSIRDNACPAIDKFEIVTANVGASQHLESVELIIDHQWPADLAISLVSPTGQLIRLVEHQGIFTQHFGNPLDLECSSSTIFNDLACERLMNGATTLIESFKPLDNLATLSGDLNGTWLLEVCDRASGDIGIIKQCTLVFSEVSCQVPMLESIDLLTGTNARLSWADTLACNRIVINYGLKGFNINQGTLEYIECIDANSFTIDNLIPDTEYEVYVANECSEMDLSPYSCSYIFKTLCAPALVVEDFDDLDPCSPFCLNPCTLNSTWTNSSTDDVDWIASTSIETNQPSGLDLGVFGIGNYLILQNDREICNVSSTGVLTSPCIYIDDNAGNCSFHFYHFLTGDNTTIDVRVIDANNGKISTIATITNQIGSAWNDTTIDLSPYAGETVSIQLAGTNSNEDFGLVAIDQLSMLEGLDPFHPSLTFFLDNDNDGYGDSNLPIYGCLESLMATNIASQGNDCDDYNSEINPGVEEQPCNGIDENCNGNIDDLAASNMEYNIQVIMPNTCENANDGSITVSISGGTPPYDVLWNHDDSGTTITNLVNGDYSATVTDAVGCAIDIEPITLFNTYNIPYTILSLTHPDCMGVPNGSINLAIGLTEGNYSIQWSSGQTGTTINSLPSGIYTATITNNDGCQTTIDPITLTPNLSGLAGVQFKRNVDCAGGSNGRIRLAPTGTENLTYNWENNIQGIERVGLAAGTYSVTVTDPSSNCFEIIDNIQITEPDSLSYNIDNIFQNLCFDDENGGIFISTSGGTKPYSYSWSNGGFTDDILRLRGDQYQVTISDSRGCAIVSDTIEILNPEEILISVDALGSTKCIDSENGFIDISAEGGTGGLAYQWNTNPITFTQDLSDIKASSYSVTVVDELGCKQVLRNINLDTEGIVLTSQVTVINDIDCHGDSNAVISVVLEEGDAPYDYNWSSGFKHISESLKDTLVGLSIGSYDVTITDASGCTSIGNTVTINQPQAISHRIDTLIHLPCNQDSSGIISISINNAAEPYGITWSDTQDSTTLTDLKAGQYSATVIDDNGCEYVVSTIELTEPTLLVLGIVVNDVSSTTLGSIEYNVSGGKSPYKVSLDGINQPYTGVLPELNVGEYQLLFEDANGCLLDTLLRVDISSSTVDILSNNISISPNPATEYVNIRSEQQIIELRLISIDGTIVKSAINTDNIDLSDIPDAVYFLQIQLDNRTVITRKINKTSW